MQNLIHWADISNSCKKWDLCLTWTDLLFEEFFFQVSSECATA